MASNFFCSQKFDWLEIRLYDGYVSSCCKSTPDRLTRKFLQEDPQGFFNWPGLLQERQMMLAGEAVPGCGASCWIPESQGLPSRRLTQASTDPGPWRHRGLRHIPSTITLIVNHTCSLTCSYCAKVFSSSWLKDVVEHGDYNIPGHENRYNASSHDQILHQISQPRLDQSAIANDILRQLEANREHIKDIIIVGGEPLLYGNLERILEMFADKNITVFSGLGTTTARLHKLLPVLKRCHVRLKISAENIGALHEFNRHGSRYAQFRNNFDLIHSQCPTSFWSVVSNLTLFGLADFLEANHRHGVAFDIAYEPDFMQPNVLDDHSKHMISQRLDSWLHHAEIPGIIDAMNKPCSNNQQQQLSMFLARFIKPRNISLDVFPQSFQHWISQSDQQS